MFNNVMIHRCIMNRNKVMALPSMGSFEDAFLKALENSKRDSYESQCPVCTDTDCQCGFD